ncbi:DUF2061 domain-containing protein [Namhaeicola litoreus]|uniref:DUF2061 domain-containing protein n=1 Tax=Namhaeicola litoreus TaxID=1052145 RepID=A0ABW3Y2G5_9FLAO
MILDKVLDVDHREASQNSPLEKTSRSIAKSISWRIVGTLDTIVISYLITGTLSLALSIGAVETITKILLYFFHERAWNFIKWGKNEA